MKTQCLNCGKRIYLTYGKRLYCRKKDNLECFRERAYLRQKRRRAHVRNEAHDRLREM